MHGCNLQSGTREAAACRTPFSGTNEWVPSFKCPEYSFHCRRVANVTYKSECPCPYLVLSDSRQQNKHTCRISSCSSENYSNVLVVAHRLHVYLPPVQRGRGCGVGPSLWWDILLNHHWPPTEPKPETRARGSNWRVKKKKKEDEYPLPPAFPGIEGAMVLSAVTRQQITRPLTAELYKMLHHEKNDASGGFALHHPLLHSSHQASYFPNVPINSTKSRRYCSHYAHFDSFAPFSLFNVSSDLHCKRVEV